MSDWGRFQQYVRLNPNGCLDWVGTLRNGYGSFWFRGENIGAHRFSYLFHHSEIPEGYHIHHKCHNKICVNIEHLEALTPKAHLLLGDTFQRRNSLKTHCPKGHPLSGLNIVKRKQGWRECNECSKIRHRKWVADNRSQQNTYNRRKRHITIFMQRVM